MIDWNMYGMIAAMFGMFGMLFWMQIDIHKSKTKKHNDDTTSRSPIT